MDIELLLRRSDELDATIMRMLDLDRYPEYGYGAKRMGLSVTAASLSIDHARALRSLTDDGFLSSAVPLLRLQFESTTRSAWLLFAASEGQVALAAAPLTVETDEAARKLPVAHEKNPLSEMDRIAARSSAVGPRTSGCSFAFGEVLAETRRFLNCCFMRTH